MPGSPPTAVLIGRVRLAEAASIWWGAVLRGDNELLDIGAGSNVQDGCVLHTDMGFPMTIGAGCTVGHKAILHGCVLEDNVLVGMGATVLNGARIGRNSLVGANALVPEGRQIPENSLVVGMPAKVVRTLTDAEVEGLKRSAGRLRRQLAPVRRGPRGRLIGRAVHRGTAPQGRMLATGWSARSSMRSQRVASVVACRFT
jgi:carbonic anhydrase/acetyltransferase-like protein (isoleucine patch superfamily)